MDVCIIISSHATSQIGIDRPVLELNFRALDCNPVDIVNSGY